MMKIRTIVSVTLFLSLFVVTLIPSATYAKEREQRGERGEREVRKEEKALKSSIKKQVKEDLDDLHDQLEQRVKTPRVSCAPFGHFIAPGWIFKNGSSTLEDKCWFPRGIQMNWWWMWNGNGENASSTDTTAPTISSVRTWPLARAVFISWTTNESADGAVFWSKTTPVDVTSSSTARREQNARTRSHQMFISGLSATTTYYAIVRSRDTAGNVAYSPEFTFATRGGTTTAPVADVTPPVISSVILTAGTSTVNVSWTTNEVATSRIFYSSSTPVSISTTTTPFVESGTLVTSHTLGISALSTSTTYYIRVQSADAAENTQTTGEFSTTTAGL